MTDLWPTVVANGSMGPNGWNPEFSPAEILVEPRWSMTQKLSRARWSFWLAEWKAGWRGEAKPSGKGRWKWINLSYLDGGMAYPARNSFLEDFFDSDLLQENVWFSINLDGKTQTFVSFV